MRRCGAPSGSWRGRRNKHLPVADAGTLVGIIDALFHRVRLNPR
jgi:hypothetical protein